MLDRPIDRQIAFVETVNTSAAAHQYLRGEPLNSQSSRLEDAAPPKVTAQYNNHAGLHWRLLLDEVLAHPAKPGYVEDCNSGKEREHTNPCPGFR